MTKDQNKGISNISYNNQYTQNSPENNYLYGGKELQKDYDLNWYDYEARFYDPALAAFVNVDPLAENRIWLSPYNFVQNNPISRIDPSGMGDDYFQNELDGSIYYNSSWGMGDEMMLGSDWSYLGPNNMFYDGGFGTNDLSLLHHYHAITNLDIGGPLTGYFSGENARSFMGDMGYEFLRYEYKFHSDITKRSFGDANGPFPTEVDQSHVDGKFTSRYVHNSLSLIRTEITGSYGLGEKNQKDYWSQPPTSRHETWTYRRDIYGEPNYFGQVFKGLKWFDALIPWQGKYENFWKSKLNKK